MELRHIAIILSASIIMGGCSVNSSNIDNNSEINNYTLYADLASDSFDSLSDRFQIADGWSNGSMFDCTWRKENCVFDGEQMSLVIDEDKKDGGGKYSGGEFRSKDFYGFGKYEVVMKPVSNTGVVSSFFTYTGPSDNNPWDEIDIEFLGTGTTKVQFNYFTDGEGNHEYIYELGFDASADFHTYGFEWTSDGITWLVDNETVYTASENIPQTPSKIMMNVWPGTGVDSWLGEYDGNTPLTACYKEICFTAYDDNDNTDE